LSGGDIAGATTGTNTHCFTGTKGAVRQRHAGTAQSFTDLGRPVTTRARDGVVVIRIYECAGGGVQMRAVLVRERGNLLSQCRERRDGDRTVFFPSA